MGLFDEENPPVEESSLFDEKDKVRLFQTHNESGKSISHYLKVILPIVLGVIIIGALAFYFMLPSRGDVVRSPSGMEDAIDGYYADTERRSVENVTTYYCEDHYAATVQLVPNSYIPGKAEDRNLPRHVVAFKKEGSGWDIKPSTAESPCE
jgi:hypothetical protein